MKDKLIALASALVTFIGDLLKESGGLSKLTIREVLRRLVSSRLWVTVGALLAALLWQRLGIPEDKLVEFWATLFGIAGAYMAANTVTKSKEIASAPDPSAPPTGG